MDYFLINHKYHLSFLNDYFPSEMLKNSVVLVNGYLLTNDDIATSEFGSVVSLVTDKSGYGVLRSSEKIRLDLEVNRGLLKEVKGGDTLYIFTEMDFVNMWVIQFFHQHQCHVNLMEDGTYTASYYPIQKHQFEAYKFARFVVKQMVLYKMKQFVFGIDGIRYLFAGRDVIMKLPDAYYDKIFITCNYEVGRNIQPEVVRKIKPHVSPPDFEEGAGYLFNSLHYYDVTLEKYLDILDRTLTHIRDAYQLNRLIFIFHPRESSIHRNLIRKVLARYPYVSIAPEQKDTRSIVSSHTVEYHFAYISGAITEYDAYADKSIYLIREFPEITNKTVAGNFYKFLLQRDKMQPLLI